MKDIVLITGGLGYIGSHIYLSLIKKDYYPIIIDDLSTSNISIVKSLTKITSKKVDFYEGDIRNTGFLKDIILNKKINTIIHLAGKKSVEESVINSKNYMDCNVGGTESIIRSIEGTGCNKIIFSSSALVYGNAVKQSIDEKHPLSSNSPYAESKILSERALLSKSQNSNDLSIGILRYFNPAGADTSGFIGDNPNSIYKNLFVILDDIALGLKDNIEIYGNDYETSDGTCIRDYLHVTDLAEGHINLIELLNKTSSNQIFNLGSGRGYSVLEVLREYEKANKVTFIKKITQRREGDVPILRADISQAEKLLGWENKFSLEEMCRSSLNFRKFNSLL
ncbi:UDP-glucose 4-epimerase GalE [Pelagibacteraceae bacterium]|nr:UDP-glucose 4-epimerase GalE [Pelagibacteraceae bacterium]